MARHRRLWASCGWRHGGYGTVVLRGHGRLTVGGVATASFPTLPHTGSAVRGADVARGAGVVDAAGTDPLPTEEGDDGSCTDAGGGAPRPAPSPRPAGTDPGA